MEMKHFQSSVLQNFDPEAYHFFGLWRQSLFSECFWVSSWNQELLSKLGLQEEESGILILRDGNFFVKKSEIENIKQQIYRKIDEKDADFFQNMVDVANAEYQQALVYADTLAEKQVSSEEFWEFVVAARRVNFLWFLGAEQLSEATEAKLREVVIEEQFPAEQVNATIPQFETPLNQQYRQVLALKKEIGIKTLTEVMADEELSQKMSYHVKSFAWIEIANYVGTSLTIEKLYDQIQHSEEQQEPEPIQGTPSDNLMFHAECLSQCGYIRQAGAEHYAMLTEKALPYLQSIASSLGLAYEELLFQRDVEIFEALSGSLSQEVLKYNAIKRKNGKYLLFAGKGEQVFFTEEAQDVAHLEESMLPRADEGVKTLRGQIGNTGKYVGTVKVIMNISDFAKMEPGDVLVSTMTTPDFVMLMHKAGAIVTDIGGMLCHAAIVSREIDKPCIIGTKFATQVLKDGDLVEVDADNGIVRILQK